MGGVGELNRLLSDKGKDGQWRGIGEWNGM